MESGVIIGKDSTIYFCSKYALYAAKYDGTILWQRYFGNEQTCTPILNSNGDILLVTTPWEKIYSFNSKGDTLWSYLTSNKIWAASLVIDKLGNIYFTNSNYELKCLSTTGQLLWTLKDSRIKSSLYCKPAFSPDGKTLYIQGYGVGIMAVDLSQHVIKWTYATVLSNTSPVVSNEGLIYIVPDPGGNALDTFFYCLNQDGSLCWKYPHYDPGNILEVTPTIDRLGNVYFGAFDTIYSFNYKGEFRWKRSTNNKGKLYEPILCDADNKILIATFTGSYSSYSMICFSSDGEKLWEISDASEREMGCYAALSENGIIFYPTFRSKNFFILK